MKKHLKKLLPFLLLLVSFTLVLPFLTSCSGTIDGVNGSEIVNLVFPQPIIFVAQIIATIILFIVVSKFVWKPYNEMIEKRKQYVMGEMNEIEAKKVSIYEEEAKIKETMTQTQIRASQMIEDARVQSANIISESKIEAQKNYDLSLKEAASEVEIMKLKMQNEMQNENVDLILSATEELTKKNIKSVDNKKFVEDFLSKIDKEL